MKNTFYEDDELNAAAVLLSSTSPDIVDSVIRLVRKEGAGLTTTLFASAASAKGSHSRPLAIMSKQFVPSDLFEDVWRGLCLILMGTLRNQKLGHDEWEKYLQSGYSLPPAIASALADRIDSEDILHAAGEGKVRELWNTVKEGARKVLNAGARNFGLPWEIDQNQEYDVDRLNEIRTAGIVVRELDDRVRLVNGQTLIAKNMGLFTAKGQGDPSGSSPLTELGDACYEIGTPALPLEMYGGLGKLFKLGRGTSFHKAASAASEAKAGGGGAIGSLFLSLLQSEPIKDAIRNLVSSGKGDAEYGDAEGMGDVVAAEYGDAMAEHYRNGDVEAMIGEILQQAGEPHDNFTTGDPRLDAVIESQALGEIEGDPIYSDPQVGGLLTNWKIRRMKARAARLRRKNLKRSSKQRAKDREAEALERARQELAAAKAGEGYQEYSGFQDTGYTEQQQQSTDSGNPDGGSTTEVELPNMDGFGF